MKGFILTSPFRASRIRWLTYKGVKIRVEKSGKYSLVDIPSFLMMIRPRDADNGDVITLAAKLRLAKVYIDEYTEKEKEER